jgi:hypothetical protein
MGLLGSVERSLSFAIIAKLRVSQPTGIVMSGRRPLIKGNFGVLRWSRVRSCLRPVDAGYGARGP